jgi:hypothetical protein
MPERNELETAGLKASNRDVDPLIEKSRIFIRFYPKNPVAYR